MKAHLPQKEILLITGTSFEQRRLERYGNKKNYPSLKKGIRRIFKQSDWSTILPVILPEIIDDEDDESRIAVSFIRKGHSFIQLEMSPEPLIIEREYSLDPYLFLSSQIFN